MDDATTSPRPRPLQLAVVSQEGSWRILVNGEGVGRFEDQADAARCAIDIAGKTESDGQPVEVLLQDAFGHVSTLTSRRAA